MATKITLIIDQYFHRWAEPDGELWFVLRPYVSSAAAFAFWAQNPESLVGEDGQPYGFAFLRGQQGCPPVLFPINLPSGLALWHGLSRNGGAPTWTAYDRASGGTVLEDGVAAPYALTFNQAAAKGAALQGPTVVANALGMQFQAGSEIGLDRVSAHFTTQGVPNPIYRCDLQGQFTSIFWLMGLMHRVGERAKLSDLSAISAYDLVITAEPVGPSNGQPPTAALARLSLPSAEPGEGPEAERAFFQHWLTKIPSGAFEASLEAKIAIVTPDQVWSKPARRTLEPDKSAPGDKLYLRLAHGDRRLDLAALSLAPVMQSAPSPDYAYDPLKLAALELKIEDRTLSAIPDLIKFEPGLLATGRLKPYRRFPVLRAPDQDGAPAEERRKHPTIMIFEPDEHCAKAFEAYLALTPRDTAQAALKAALKEAVLVERPEGSTPASAWTAHWVSTSALPWDGGKPCLRVLATPQPIPPQTAPPPVERAEPRGLMQADLSFFLPTEAAATLRRVEQYDFDVPVDPAPAAGPGNAQARLEEKTVPSRFATAFWKGGLSGPAPFNTLRLDLSGLSKDARSRLQTVAAYRDDFEFEQAQSVTRLEGELQVTTVLEAAVIAAATAGGMPDPAGLSPFRAVAEEWANYTVARQVDETGKPVDFNAQAVRETTGCDGNLLGIEQRAPFSKSWRESPRDPARDEKDPPRVDSALVRRHVADLYGLVIADPVPKRAVRIAAKHTYGDQRGARALAPVAAPDWPVELPTAAEIRQPVPDPSPGSPPSSPRDGAPFLRVRYENIGNANAQLTLIFDPRVLTFPAPDPQDADLARRKRQEDAYHVGLLAWRALGELARAQAIDIEVEPVAYDLFAREEGRLILAQDWRHGLRTLPRRRALLDAAARKQLSDWAADCFTKPLPTAEKKLVLALESGANLGQTAAIARVMMRVSRSNAMVTGASSPTRVANRLASDRARDLSEGQRQLADTLDAAWCAAAQNQSIETSAFDHWRAQRRAFEDSITPEDPGTFDTVKFAKTMRGLREGTDWFPPPASPDYSQDTVQTTLTPFGFCAPAPHPDLGDGTQKALETLLRTYQDYIDLALATPQPVEKWETEFADIEKSLPGWTALRQALVTQLIAPQPAVADTTTTVVAERVKWMTGAGKTRLQQETLRLLEERPALYADAKAFLLSELSLLNPAKERTLSPLAGATYRRFVRPWGAAQPSVAATDLTPVVKAVLDIARLRLLDDAASIEPVQAGLGFYEALDDATYDNSFEVTVGGQQIEPFEAVVDPGSLGAKTWKTATPATPIAEDQTKPVRRVPLASRRSVKAPIMTGSAVIAAFQAGGLKKGQQLNLAALYAGQALVSPTGDHRVQDAWRSSQAPAFEEQIFTLIYVVQGDEEGDQGSNALFNNDLFSIDLVAIERHQAAISDRREPRTPHPLAAQLGGLVSSPRGSPEARQQIAALAPALAQVAAEFVKPPPSPPTAPTVGFQILPDGVGFKIQPVGDLAAAARKALRNIAFLRREGQKDSGSGLLIVDVATDVWDELGVRLTQTRNAVTPVYAFDPAFRQGAAQATPPAHRRPTKAGRNTPLAWVRPGPVKLPNRRISVKDLLYALKAAPMDGVAGALFTPSKAIASGYRLSVSVFEEQFLRPARANFPAPQPEGRLLAFNVQCAMSETSVAQTMIEFPKPGAAFSVDLHWTAPGGDVALRLERLFVRTTADAS